MNLDPPTKLIPKKWILVIEDQPTIRDILERFLQVDGYFVSTATHAAEGLERARSLPIDLVVLDLDLPWSSGLTVRAGLNDDPVTAHLPLLLISSRLSKRDLQKAATAARDGFLPMPFSLAEVRETVSRLLGPASALALPA